MSLCMGKNVPSASCEISEIIALFMPTPCRAVPCNDLASQSLPKSAPNGPFKLFRSSHQCQPDLSAHRSTPLPSRWFSLLVSQLNYFLDTSHSDSGNQSFMAAAAQSPPHGGGGGGGIYDLPGGRPWDEWETSSHFLLLFCFRGLSLLPRMAVVFSVLELVGQTD